MAFAPTLKNAALAAVAMAIAISPDMASAQSVQSAQSEQTTIDREGNNHKIVGAGLLMTESPFKGEGTFYYPIPIASIKLGSAYIEGLEAGLTLERQFAGITPSISIFAAGRNTAARDRQELTADAGIRVSLSSAFGELSAEYRHDVTGKFNGSEWGIQYAHPINLGGLVLVPSAQINWLDRKTANQMYGVTAKQHVRSIQKNRSAILPVAPINQSAMNLSGSLTGIYSITNHVKAVAVLSGTLLDKSIYKSPAIDQKWESTAMIGLAYSF